MFLHKAWHLFLHGSRLGIGGKRRYDSVGAARIAAIRYF
ncbi:MAG: hypothetical protein ACI80I_001996 [Akkermansiaceae bacterium]|jgi:hypothetical protein